MKISKKIWFDLLPVCGMAKLPFTVWKRCSYAFKSAVSRLSYGSDIQIDNERTINKCLICVCQ